MNLPKRTADTMSDAIALSSPSGRMSKRARKEAEKRLALSLFGPGGLHREQTHQPSQKHQDLQQADRLEELANRGMNTRKYLKEAARLRALWST